MEVTSAVVKTLTSTNKLLLLFIFAGMIVSTAAASHYGDDSIGSITGTDTGFQVPHFDSQQELVAELVAPFIFISVLLQFALAKALHWTVRDQDHYPPPLGRDNKPSVNRQATLLSITITAMLIPTPFWSYLRLAIQSVGVIAVAGVVILVGMTLYYMLSPNGRGE